MAGNVIEDGRRAAVTVPASSANLGPGFDSIGLALELRDRLEARVGGDELRIEVSGHGAGEVPSDDRHLVWRSMAALWRRLDVTPPRGLTLICDNAIPHSRGLGSSASAIVGGVGLAARLAGLSLDDADDLAIVNDVAAALEGHPDNSSASVYGGLTVSWWDEFAQVWRTARPQLLPEIRATVFVPDETLATSEARSTLPPMVPLRDAAATAARAALLVQALTRDPHLLLPATREWLHQENRRSAYPRSMAVVDRLRESGHAAVISGAGPTVLVLGVAPVEIEAGAGWQVLEPEIARHGIRDISQAHRRGV